MKSIINFWKKDIVNKLIVLAGLALIAGLVFIVFLVATAPKDSTLYSTYFPALERTPTPLPIEATSTSLSTPTTAFFPSVTPLASTARPPAGPTLAGLTPSAVPVSATPPAAGASPLSCIPGNPPQDGNVVNVIDGDTIKVYMQSKVYVVRYIGIAVDDVDQPYAQAATTENYNLVFAKKVSLIQDSSDKDSFGRLLRYVLVGNTFVNYELVQQGFATASPVAPNGACAQVFQNAQQSAKAARLGRWAPTPTAAPASP